MCVTGSDSIVSDGLFLLSASMALLAVFVIDDAANRSGVAATFWGDRGAGGG
jgi:hypothetical protein